MPLLPSGPEVSSADQCAICHECLLLPNNDGGPRESTYEIDDLELRCGHHFHESCLYDYALSSPNTWEHCALCQADGLNQDGEYNVSIKMDDGSVRIMDLKDDINEHILLNSNPEAARVQRFLSHMSDGELEEAEKYLKNEDGMGEGELSPDVKHETGGHTAMHEAAYNDDVEGIRLLLRYGADKNIKDSYGQSALDCARLADAKNVIGLLEN